MSLLIKDFPETLKNRFHIALLPTRYKTYDIIALVVAKFLYDTKNDSDIIKMVNEMMNDKKYDNDGSILQLRDVIRRRRDYPITTEKNPVQKSAVLTDESLSNEPLKTELLPSEKKKLFGGFKK